jgi:hypothetical protein
MSASGGTSGLFASKAGGTYGAISGEELLAPGPVSSAFSTDLQNHSTAPHHIFPDAFSGEGGKLVTSESSIFSEYAAEDEAATALRQAQGHSGVVFNTATALLGASMFSMPYVYDTIIHLSLSINC